MKNLVWHFEQVALNGVLRMRFNMTKRGSLRSVRAMLATIQTALGQSCAVHPNIHVKKARTNTCGVSWRFSTSEKCLAPDKKRPTVGHGCWAVAEYASRRRTADGAGFRTSDWNTGTLPLWQASRQLCGVGAIGRVQWRSATTGTHQQTRQRAAALSVSRSGAGHGVRIDQVL